MALTQDQLNKLVKLQLLQTFKELSDAKYLDKTITAITGLEANTVEGALAEIFGKVTALPSAIIPKGSKAYSGLNPATDLAAANVGFMWNITDAFTTTADFAEGADHSIPAGANVYVANVGTAETPSYKYDIFQGMYDLSGYALKSEMAIGDVSGDSTKKNITLKNGLSQQVVVSHQDISGKANIVSGATNGNFAGLDSDGNLTDSGYNADDFLAAGDYKTIQTAVDDPTANGNAAAFIDSISQDTNGVITVTKKNVQAASAIQAGLMSAADFSKLDAIAYASDAEIRALFGIEELAGE